MHASREHWSPWCLPSGVAIASALLAWASAGDPRWHDLLDYRRAAVAGGEVWRPITAHLMHLSVEHAVLDIAGLALVAWIFADEMGWRLQATSFVVGIAFIDVALWVTQIDRYVGLSGVLHAWFAAGAVCWLLASHDDPLARRKRAWGAALLVGLGVKMVLELRDQAFWLDGASFTVVTAAHRCGAAAGVVCGLGAVVFRRRGAAGDAGRAWRGR